ncbi:hypothetical protein DICVIV_02597 [Dictyocaulus viviparus]|uniref:FERM domain-containing protein n=1 Tax=Dictyocaulus viviparus TaxID=29172 RepID=A0A0D8Y4Y4_DICVI|nr:hypothetical protein DICVIV_02597 [Dictyocaulus viviparus]
MMASERERFANEQRRNIILSVTLMDGSVKELITDSATTISECCTAIAENIGLKETFGFSLYIVFLDKNSDNDIPFTGLCHLHNDAPRQPMTDDPLPFLKRAPKRIPLVLY